MSQFRGHSNVLLANNIQYAVVSFDAVKNCTLLPTYAHNSMSLQELSMIKLEWWMNETPIKLQHPHTVNLYSVPSYSLWRPLLYFNTTDLTILPYLLTCSATCFVTQQKYYEMGIYLNKYYLLTSSQTAVLQYNIIIFWCKININTCWQRTLQAMKGCLLSFTASQPWACAGLACISVLQRLV